MPSLGGCFGPTSSVRDFDIYIGRTKLEYHDDILPAIFMSHRGLAKALGEHGFESLFLDIDPEGGIQAGSRWEAVPYSNLIRSRAVIARHSEPVRIDVTALDSSLTEFQGAHSGRRFGICPPVSGGMAQLL